MARDAAHGTLLRLRHERVCRREPGWQFPETGDYECVDLRPCFEDPQSHPFFIRVDGELAGFAVVEHHGSAPEIKPSMAQSAMQRTTPPRLGAERLPVGTEVIVLPVTAKANQSLSATPRRTIGQIGSIENNLRTDLNKWRKSGSRTRALNVQHESR